MMVRDSELILERRKYSLMRLAEVRQRVGGIDPLEKLPNLCIYVTGSYGRLEASEYSDLDLFFIHRGTRKKDQVPRIEKTLLDARLIDLARDLHFPEFSRDGEYLTVHYIDDIREALGSPADDFENFFTARLLLLLESRALYNEELYEELVESAINSYFRDFHDHETTFRPIFLINDIIRFWRTLCLNYEHRRNRPLEDTREKNKNHLMNLKLKFSRLLTCFSTVILLSRNRDVLTPRTFVEIIGLPPIERLDRAAEIVPSAESLVSEIKDRYARFLNRTGRPKEEVLNWISDRGERDQAFAEGRVFHSQMYDLLLELTKETDTMRYLVI